MTPYLPHDAAEAKGVRLFCFHHAGGGASTFAGWQDELGPKVTVLPVQLPGRERRAVEPRFTDMAELVADLDRQLDPELTEPYAFYGHSMGAIVAYNLVRRRWARGASLPFRLMVGAHAPPHVRAPIANVLGLSDDGLVRWLLDVGGMSETLTRYPDWVRAALGLTRDDLRLCQSHEPVDAEPLPCPIEVFAGEHDPLLPPAAAGGWARHTSAGCRTHAMPGGHLFIRDEPGIFLHALAAALHPL